MAIKTAVFETPGGEPVSVNAQKVLYTSPTELGGCEAVKITFSADHEIVVFGKWPEVIGQLFD